MECKYDALAEWLRRQPAKLLPQGARVRIPQASFFTHTSTHLFVLQQIMSKQLVGTSLYATNSKVNLKIPVAESFLPVQMVKGAHQDLPKELVYSNDARNAHFELSIACSDGVADSTRVLEFSKEQLARFFEKLEVMQDELNSYM